MIGDTGLADQEANPVFAAVVGICAEELCNLSDAGGCGGGFTGRNRADGDPAGDYGIEHFVEIADRPGIHAF